MRPLDTALAAAALLASTPASAQYANHGIAVESGISSPLASGSGPRATFALAASAWLEGDVEGVARVAYGSAAETGGRAAGSAITGTLGIRLSLVRGPLRPQLFVDAGWARVEAGGVASDRVALGLGAALEWFPSSEVSISPRVALRAAGGEPSIEVALALGGYF